MIDVNYLARINDALIEWVGSAPWVSDVARVIADELDELHEAIDDDLRESSHIETARLDALNRHARELLLRRRAGETDTELRQRMGLELAINRSEGTIDDVQGLLVSGAWAESGEDWNDDVVELVEGEKPAFFRIELSLGQLEDVGRDRLERIVHRAKSAAVGFSLQSVGTFGYQGVDGEEFENIDGYNEGRYSGVSVVS